VTSFHRPQWDKVITSPGPGCAPGLRERKKQITRPAILETAQAMFDERARPCTVAEIADA